MRGFTGSHRYLVDYVQEDILAHVEKPLQDFLLHCAILNRMSAALCQVVTEQADLQTSQKMLEQLERSNLFLVPLDEERHWYRLHDLFREALLARLHATQPEMVRLLHMRAAGFYERQGEWSEAISHRLSAADYASALHLMEQTAEHFWLHGEVKALYRWIMVLPDEVVRTRTSLILKTAWYLLNYYAHTAKAQLSPVRAQVEHLLVRVEEALLWAEREQQDQLCPGHSLLRQRVSLVRLISEAAESESDSDLEQYRLLTQQGSQMSLEDDDIFWQTIPLGLAFVYHYMFLGKGALLIPRLLEVKRQTSQAGDRFAMLKVKQWLALASFQAGQLRQAHRECLEALVLLEHSKEHTVQAGYFSLCLAYVFFAWNRLDEARAILRRVIPDVAAGQRVDLLMWGYTLLTELEVVAGNLAAAHEVLQEEQFRLLSEQEIYPFWRTGPQVRLWLAQGNMVEANAWAAQVAFHHIGWKYQHIVGLLALLRIYLAQQQYSQALELLEEFQELVDRPEGAEYTISFLSFSATALYQAGMHERARTAALRLLNLTRQEGYLRVYLDMGEPMKQLLQSLLDAPQDQGNESSSVPGSYISMLLAAFEQEKHRRATHRETPSANSRKHEDRKPLLTSLPGSITDEPVLLETLTSQEQRVLRLLAAGRSNQEIAQALVVSRNTVKTHLKNLYSKFQVHSRAQALVLARDLQLL